MFFRLLMESFRRQKRRKALAGAAILLGTTAVTAMLALATTIGDRIHQELAVYGANIVVTPKAGELEVNLGGVQVKPATGGAYLHEADLGRLKTIFWANNITGVSPELDVDARASFADAAAVPVRLRGLWFDHDLAGMKTGAPTLHPWWKLTGTWPVMDPAQAVVPVVVGSTVAGLHGLHVGSDFYVGEPSTRAQVSGIVTTGDATDGEVLTPLAAAQALLPGGAGMVGRVDVRAKTRPEDAFARRDPETLAGKQRDLWYCRPYANSIAYQIREAVPGADAQQVRRVEQTEGAVLSRISGLMWLISGAALLAAGFAVSAAMATAVLERRHEIGLMRSLGAGKAAVAALFLSESTLLAVAAGTVGYLAGSLLAYRLGLHIFPGDAAGVVFNGILLPVVLALAVLVAVAGSWPSLRAGLEASPSDTLRGNS